MKRIMPFVLLAFALPSPGADSPIGSSSSSESNNAELFGGSCEYQARRYHEASTD